MYVLVYSIDYCGHKRGEIHSFLRDAASVTSYRTDILDQVEIPEQDVSRIYNEDSGLWEGRYPEDLVTFSEDEIAAISDRTIARAINRAVHQFCPIEKQIGILRDQLRAVLDLLGGETTAEFNRLERIVSEEKAASEGRDQ